MCGIFGWNAVYKNKRTRRKIPVLAAVLAHANDKRGGDSWGIYAFGSLTKGLGDLCHADPATTGTMFNAPSVLGHTRKATTGDIVPENSHPFRIQNLVGAHNGQVTNHEELNKANGRSCEVDSQHIFHHIAEDKPLTDINAYGAIEYIRQDAEDDGVYLGKFNGGDLAIAQTEIGPVWNSNKWDLISALRVAGIKFRLYKIEENNLYRLAENKAYHVKKMEFGKYVPKYSYTGTTSYDGWYTDSERCIWDKDTQKWISLADYNKKSRVDNIVDRLKNSGSHHPSAPFTWDQA